MNNLHLCLNTFQQASRVLKETSSLSSLNEIDNVFIGALHAPDLKEDEKISRKIFLKRFVLKTRYLGQNSFIKFIKYIEFAFKVLSYYGKKKIEIINVHSISLLPLGYMFKLLYDSILIYDTHELETEKNGLKGVQKKIAKLIEKLLIYKVDHIFVVSENIANWYYNNYEISRPTVIFNAPKIQYLKKNNYFREKFNLRNDQVIFLYQGGLFSGRGIKLLIDVFKKRKNDKAIILFMGFGKFEKEIINSSNFSNTIFFHKVVDPMKILSHTISADVGVSMIENICLSYNFCMPNKLFEYLMAGLPVMVSDVKEMSEFVKLNKIGVVVRNNSIEDLDNAIDQIIKSDLNEISVNAKKTAIKNSWEGQENKMIKIYKDLVNTSSRIKNY